MVVVGVKVFGSYLPGIGWVEKYADRRAVGQGSVGDDSRPVAVTNSDFGKSFRKLGHIVRDALVADDEAVVTFAGVAEMR